MAFDNKKKRGIHLTLPASKDLELEDIKETERDELKNFSTIERIFKRIKSVELFLFNHDILDVDKVGKVADYLTKKYGNRVTVTYSTDYLKPNELLKIKKLKEKYNIRVVHPWHTEKEVELEKIEEANEKAGLLINHIKSLNLSPFEQYILIHDFCSAKPYRESFDDENESRSFVGCMTTDKIVCVGYAVLMEKLCGELGIKCERIDALIHHFNIVDLVDKKYNINGKYLTDACWDETIHLGDSGDANKYHGMTKNYLYLAFPFAEIDKDGHKAYNFSLKPDKDKGGSPISIQKLKTAVENAYKALDGEYYDQETVDNNIDATIKRAQEKNLDPYPDETKKKQKKKSTKPNLDETTLTL